MAEVSARPPAKDNYLLGENDIFLTHDGGEAYLQDLPNAEMQRLDSGHFALEDCHEQIAANMQRFYNEKVTPVAQTVRSRRAG